MGSAFSKGDGRRLPAQQKAKCSNRRLYKSNARRNRLRQGKPSPCMSRSHYADIDDGEVFVGSKIDYPPIISDGDYYYMNKAGSSVTLEKATCTTSDFLNQNEIQDFSRPGRDRASNFPINDCENPRQNHDTDEAAETANVQEAVIKQSVDAFREVLVEQIRVTEILQLLPFLVDTAAISSRFRDSPRDAVTCLLDQLCQCHQNGKWTTFLNALKIAGYETLVNTLLGNSVLDTSEHRNILKIFAPEIVQNLLPGDLMNRLYSKDIITLQDLEEIKCELKNKGYSAASMMLLDRIPRRKTNWYREFIHALRECEFFYLAETLDQPPEYKSSSAKGSMSEKLEKECKWYLTPSNAPSLRRCNSDELPPPVPVRGRPQSNLVTKRFESQKTSSQPARCLSLKESPVTDYILEKRRLEIELMDLRAKLKLNKHIKKLNTEIEKALVDYSDDEGTGECKPFHDDEKLSPKEMASLMEYQTEAKQHTNGKVERTEGAQQISQNTVNRETDGNESDRNFQLTDEVKDHISQEISKAMEKTLPSACMANRVAMYRSFNNINKRFDLTAKWQLTDFYDSGVAMLPDSGI